MSDCVFCKIANKEIASDIVYEDEHVVAFNDIHPQAPTHILIIPRKHIVGLAEAGPEDAELIGRLQLAAAELARGRGVADGYRIVVNSGALAGQSVMHLHYHLLGGRALSWPPG